MPQSHGTGSEQELARDVARGCSNLSPIGQVEEPQGWVSRRVRWPLLLLCPAFANVLTFCSGNRFRLLKLDQHSSASFFFPPVVDLSLDDTLLGWSEVSYWQHSHGTSLTCYHCQITELAKTWFGSLVTLSASNNDFGSLPTARDSVEPLPLTVRSLTLDGNGFTCLDDVAALTNLPHLQRLSLKNNSIRRIGLQSSEQTFPVFSQSLSDVDLSFNTVDSWEVIDRLQDVFPGLTTLRVSHNPLYQNLRSADGRPLNADIGYMLTVARIGRLKTLNFSPVSVMPASGIYW